MLLLVMRQQDSRERQAGPILVVAQTNTAVDNVMRKLSSVMSAKDSGLSCIAMLQYDSDSLYDQCKLLNQSNSLS